MRDALQPLHRWLAETLPPERAAMASELAAASFRRLASAQLARLDVDVEGPRIIRALEAFEEGAGDQPTIQVEATEDTTVVHVHAVDGPFVVSTITEELHRLGLQPIDLAHPVVGVRRDAEGRLQELTPARQAERRETYLAMDLQAHLEPAERERVAEHVAAVLADAWHAIRDFPAMKAKVGDIVDELTDRAASRYDPEAVGEVVAFLRWLADDHFVFLGYRGYDVVDGSVSVETGSGLGIMHDEQSSDYSEPVPLAEMPAALQVQATDGPLLHIVRTTRPSTVHRQVRMVSVGVQKVTEDGRLVGEHRLLGLLAQKAFVEPSSTIPVLRRKLRAILDAEDVMDHSQDERALRTLFDAFPKQELFESSLPQLRESLVQLLDVGRADAVRLLMRPEPSGRSVSALVTVPRQSFSAELREQIQRLLADAVGATAVDYQLSMSERDQPLLHFTLHLPVAGVPDVDTEALQAEISRLTRTFTDALTDALARERGMVEARLLAERWSVSLPPAYTETTSVATAVVDVTELDALDGEDAVRMRLMAAPDGAAATGPRLLRFRLYKAGPGVELSGFLPLLESLGLVVVEEHPFALTDPPRWGEIHIHDYGVRCGIAEIDVPADGTRIAAATHAMWQGRAAVDSLNRLVTLAGMRAEEVTVLRGYRRYLRQIGTTYTEATTNDALLEHPTVARALLAYFDVRFDPRLVDPEDTDGAEDPASDRDQMVEVARKEVLTELQEVARLDQDRILRSFLGCIDATLRTNRWRERPFLSLKVDPSRVPGVPKPVPYREIFVYSNHMEGIHLRGGPVARGGLRWSDRPDDFRTEVLGLMKAQMSKNAVIVPTGSKGGFVLKDRPSDPAALRAEVEAQYRVLIRGLLDLTDSVADGGVVGPPAVVRHDGDDPYLVVAADRGTATFSDIANDISDEYGFWLGDAFASGGSQGYDHKAMGITARGAWVAVQRHFRELGHDTQTEPITVVGVGDMSGDVFGNGMLRSRTIHLVAAFDHRDVFIDPIPDPETSFTERARLFDLPRSSWQDYDRALISSGGGVWSRTVKTIPLSPEAREALRIDAEELSPPDLVRAILSAPVDLLWFGGIGTFVKARNETSAEVGDRANDAIRVDADQVGARVVGEGGNLAMTQRGRIAYARRGGRCNTDAIDNVAGVNTSDREVNLKILLSIAIHEGRLPAQDRDALLASMTEQVADQVLRDSYLQTWAVSGEVNAAPGGMGGYEMLMADLESRGRLDRVVEVLPSTAEMEERREQGAGMTRPELSVLLAYAKIDVTERLLASDVIDQPVFDPVRRGYFPDAVADRFPNLISLHRLRRELVATIVANDLCNRMGITWAARTALDLGSDVATVVGAYWIAREVIAADGEWQALEALDNRVDPMLQYQLKATVDWLVDAFSRSYVRVRRPDVGAAIAEDRGPFLQLAAQAAQWSSSRAAKVRRDSIQQWVDLGIEEELAARIAVLPALTLVPGIAMTARASDRSVIDCGTVYALIAERLPLEQLTDRLMGFQPEGRWGRAQHRGLLDDLRRLHHSAARRTIAAADATTDPQTAVEQYLGERAVTVGRAIELAHQVQAQPEHDLNALAVAVRALSDVAN